MNLPLAFGGSVSALTQVFFVTYSHGFVNQTPGEVAEPQPIFGITYIRKSHLTYQLEDNTHMSQIALSLKFLDYEFAVALAFGGAVSALTQVFCDI